MSHGVSRCLTASLAPFLRRSLQLRASQILPGLPRAVLTFPTVQASRPPPGACSFIPSRAQVISPLPPSPLHGLVCIIRSLDCS